MTINGYGFNREWAKTVTEAEFVSEFKENPSCFPEITKPTDRTSALKKAFALLVMETPASN